MLVVTNDSKSVLETPRANDLSASYQLHFHQQMEECGKMSAGTAQFYGRTNLFLYGS